MKEKELLQKLLQDIEQKYDRKVIKPKDFEQLRKLLPKGEELSVSTLKRIWGYVKENHIPREETLSILSRLAGYQDWSAFCREYNNVNDSDFLDGVLLAEDIPLGAEVLLKWFPDRICRVKKIADKEFYILEADNCKLKKYDTFEAVWFMQGHPLCVHHVTRNGKLMGNYIAGRKKGLSTVMVLTK